LLLPFVKHFSLVDVEVAGDDRRLNSLILLIAIAYSCAVIQGRKIQIRGFQKYVGRLTECGRSLR